MRKFALIGIAAGLALASARVSAEPAANVPVKPIEKIESGHEQVLRVGGEYTVTKADKRGEKDFVVEFKSEQPTGRFDVLRLESDHVHVAVKVGQKLRLSAEILSESGATADVRQVVLFFPNSVGHVPVWLLSNKAPLTDLRASKYLEMHSPSNDYSIM